jgi:hypothetical protein
MHQFLYLGQGVLVQQRKQERLSDMWRARSSSHSLFATFSCAVDVTSVKNYQPTVQAAVL